MSKKKQLTSIDKMKLKLKQQTKEKQKSLFKKKEVIYYPVPIIKEQIKEEEE
jgi:hypothetical protein